MKKILLCAALFSAAAAPAFAAKKAKTAETLAPGRYTAKVKMLACEGCGPEVEKTLNGVKGVEAAKVDSKTSTVEFGVKDPVKVAELQKTLKAASEEMGMGADYSLSKIQSLEKAAPKAGKPASKS
jgi:copper chaperone CopZ